MYVFDARFDSVFHGRRVLKATLGLQMSNSPTSKTSRAFLGSRHPWVGCSSLQFWDKRDVCICSFDTLDEGADVVSFVHVHIFAELNKVWLNK